MVAPVTGTAKAITTEAEMIKKLRELGVINETVVNLIPEVVFQGDIGSENIADGVNSTKKASTLNINVKNCGINIMPFPTFPWITTAYFDYSNKSFFQSDLDSNMSLNGYVSTQFPSPLTMLIQPLFTNFVWHWNSFEDYARTPGTSIITYYNKTNNVSREKPNQYDLASVQHTQGIDLYNSVIAQLGLNVLYETSVGEISPRAYKDSDGKTKYNWYETTSTMTGIGLSYPIILKDFEGLLSGQFKKGWSYQRSIPRLMDIDVRQSPPYNPISPTSTWSENAPTLEGYDLVHQIWDYSLVARMAYTGKIGLNDPFTLEGLALTGFWQSSKTGRFEPTEKFGLKLDIGQYINIGYALETNKAREYAAWSIDPKTKTYTNEMSHVFNLGVYVPVSGKGSHIVPKSFLDTGFTLDWEHTDGYIRGGNYLEGFKTGTVDTVRAGLNIKFNDISDLWLGNWKVFSVRQHDQLTTSSVAGQVPQGMVTGPIVYKPQSKTRSLEYYNTCAIPVWNAVDQGNGESNFRELTMEEANKKRKQDDIAAKAKATEEANRPSSTATATPVIAQETPTPVATQTQGQETPRVTSVATNTPVISPTEVATPVPTQQGATPIPTITTNLDNEY